MIYYYLIYIFYRVTPPGINLNTKDSCLKLGKKYNIMTVKTKDKTLITVIIA